MTGNKPLAARATSATVIFLSGPAFADERADQLRVQQRLNFGVPPAVTAYEQVKTLLTLKQRTLERKKQLFQQQLATQEDVEKAKKDVADTEMQVEIYEKLLMGK